MPIFREKIQVQDSAGTNDKIVLMPDGNPNIEVKDEFSDESIIVNGSKRTIIFTNRANHDTVKIDGVVGDLTLGDGSLGGDSIILSGKNHTISLRHQSTERSARWDSMILDGNGNMTVYNEEGRRSLALRSKAFDGKTAGLWIGANPTDPAPVQGPLAGKIILRDSSGRDSIVLDGSLGDINLSNSDCAEEFEVSDTGQIEPGTVMVIDKNGKLQRSEKGYDSKVAGVISGAGEYKPGIVLGKETSQKRRAAVALVGKVFCKVDAQYSQIGIGDMLTTSPTPGYAMKAADPMRAFGAIIGKSLGILKEGRGLLPILVALQ